MDRFWVIVTWIIFGSILIGVLRYGKSSLALLQTFLGWLLGESQVVAGGNPSGNAPGFPSYQTN